jgi:MATE family multidrug resistance protein
VSLGALRALLDTRWPTGVTLVAYWLVALPLGWLLAMPFGFGAAGFWTGFAIGLASAAILLFRRFLRLRLAV